MTYDDEDSSHNSKIFPNLNFPLALLKRELATIPLVILISPSGSLAFDLLWPEIWGDLVKISRGEQRTEREQIFFFLNFEQCSQFHF